ncbi:MAG: hypothetical protein AAF689_17355 [Pseudomonadota bacterium]
MRNTPHAALARLNAFHERVWPVPYAVRSAALLLGEVDFRQSPKQGKPAHLHNHATPLEALCEFDPVFFETQYAVNSIMDDLADDQHHILEHRYFEFAPDAFHKANISGGAGYDVDSQDRALDPFVPLAGMTFLQFLDETIARGGFFGALQSTRGASVSSGWGPTDPYGHDAPRTPMPAQLGATLREAAAWA